jgi:hypothetical protein
MTKDEIREFAQLLESNGFGGAIDLIREELYPVALKHGLSMYQVAIRYADVDPENEDGSWYKFGQALWKISEKDLRRLHTHNPIKKKK